MSFLAPPPGASGFTVPVSPMVSEPRTRSGWLYAAGVSLMIAALSAFFNVLWNLTNAWFPPDIFKSGYDFFDARMYWFLGVEGSMTVAAGVAAIVVLRGRGLGAWVTALVLSIATLLTFLVYTLINSEWLTQGASSPITQVIALAREILPASVAFIVLLMPAVRRSYATRRTLTPPFASPGAQFSTPTAGAWPDAPYGANQQFGGVPQQGGSPPYGEPPRFDGGFQPPSGGTQQVPPPGFP